MIMAVCATSQRSVLSVTLLLRLRARRLKVPGTLGRFGTAASFVCDVATAAAGSMAKNDLLLIGSSLSLQRVSLLTAVVASVANTKYVTTVSLSCHAQDRMHYQRADANP